MTQSAFRALASLAKTLAFAVAAQRARRMRHVVADLGHWRRLVRQQEIDQGRSRLGQPGSAAGRRQDRQFRQFGRIGGEVAHGCPRFQVWSRDGYVTIYEPGRVGDGLAVMHRGEITKTARECHVEPGRVTVKYGFSGRVLLGPKARAGRVSCRSTCSSSDAKREKVATDKLRVDVDVALDKPIGYFSVVRTVTFTIPEGRGRASSRFTSASTATSPAPARALSALLGSRNRWQRTRAARLTSTQCGRIISAPIEICGRDRSLQVRSAPKEQPPRNLSGKRTAG